jgi:hypothetical protein
MRLKNVSVLFVLLVVFSGCRKTGPTVFRAIMMR